MTVIEGELSGMKILWEGEMPVCVYMTDEKTETKEKSSCNHNICDGTERMDRQAAAVSAEFDFGKVFAEKSRWRTTDDHLRCRTCFDCTAAYGENGGLSCDDY